MIYYMCKYTPLELFAGFGEECRRLDYQADDFETADGLGHPNICGYGKGFLEAAMDPAVTKMVLINCCDVVRRIYDILKNNKKMEFLWLLDLPHGKGPAQQKLLARQLERMLKAYEEQTGQTFDPAAAVNAWRKQLEKEKPQGTYLSLQGAHGGPFLHETIQKVFSVPVVDDTCSGNRYLALPKIDAEDGKKVVAPYAASLLGQMPCLRMTEVKDRQELRTQPAGIIYHTMKFCDYYSFEYSKLKEQQEIPLLKIETDGTKQSQGQLATRLEAFAESLQLAQRKKMMNADKKYVAGIDSGSTSTDVAIMDRSGKLVSWSIVRTGIGAALGAEKALEEALKKAGISESDLGNVVATGYGRGNIGKGDSQVTEITCHARGAHYLCPETRTIIDIGGQDSKVIRIDENGNVQNFVMNDKCAAGTGRFLEMMARTMELSMEEMSTLGLGWKNEIAISSMCTVFAESEVVSLIAENRAPEDIIHGLNQAVAVKTAALVKRVGAEERFMMSGGVSRNQGVVQVLEEKLHTKIQIHELAQLCGAVGAALIALEG